MKKVLYPIFAMLVFIFMQTIVGGAISVLGIFLDPEGAKIAITEGNTQALMRLVNPNLLSIAIVVSGILTIVIIALLKMIDWKHVLNLKEVDWKNGMFAILGAALGIFTLDILEEMIHLPNLMEDTFMGMSNTMIGALSIGVLGPIIEEFIFREGFEGYMLRNGMNRWIAICASGLAFGIIHMNPAQIPFATAMGIILGIIYYKSGNIVLTSILHILNNSVAVWQMYSMGEAAKDFSLINSLGGQTHAIFTIVLTGLFCFLFLHLFVKSYKTISI